MQSLPCILRQTLAWMVCVEASKLQEFCRQHRRRLVGAHINRIRCTENGLLLDCQGPSGEFELAFLGCRTAVWSWLLPAGSRRRLLDKLTQQGSPLAESLAEDFPWQEPESTRLDALRVWLLRPASRPPEWLQLEGCEFLSLSHLPGERVVVFELLTRASVGPRESLQLQVELFSRGLNVILRDAEANELANWQGRPAATPRANESLSATDAPQADSDDLLLRALIDFEGASAQELVAESRRGRRRESRRLQQLVRGLERDLKRAEQADEWRKKGEILSANLHRIRRGQSSISLPDWDAGNEPIEMELDPALSPQQNVAQFFKRARRGARGRETIEARLAVAQAELRPIEVPANDDVSTHTWQQALQESPTTWKRALDLDAACANLATLWRLGGPPWRKAQAPAQKKPQRQRDRVTPGRRFVIDEKWEVVVGRSNAENDELTHRFAHPHDVWMHASGVPGSHVILRMAGSTDNPPRDVLQKAAAIAARFSKAKHAGTVPVIWTRKRYVRKPRGSKPGLAVCTQEKTVFVKPGIFGEEA